MTRNKERNEQIRDQRKEQILSEALHQFASKGFFATKITEISSALGISQGLIYRYYASKEEIFVELIQNALDKMNEAALGLQRMDRPPHIKIKMAITELLHTIEISDDFTKTCLLIAEATNSDAIPEDAKQIITAKRDLPYRVIAGILSAGQSAGTIRQFDPEEMALVFWTSINGLAIHKATHRDSIVLTHPEMLYHIFLEEE